MIAQIRLDEDHHVHSIFSDDAVSTLAENVAAARERGLQPMCLSDHVRQDSPSRSTARRWSTASGPTSGGSARTPARAWRRPPDPRRVAAHRQSLWQVVAMPDVPDRTRILGPGVDIRRFRPCPPAEARERLQALAAT